MTTREKDGASMPKVQIKKPRRPTDSTMRNVRAANKRIAALELAVRGILARLYALETKATR